MKISRDEEPNSTELTLDQANESREKSEASYPLSARHGQTWTNHCTSNRMDGISESLTKF